MAHQKQFIAKGQPQPMTANVGSQQAMTSQQASQMAGEQARQQSSGAQITAS